MLPCYVTTRTIFIKQIFPPHLIPLHHTIIYLYILTFYYLLSFYLQPWKIVGARSIQLKRTLIHFCLSMASIQFTRQKFYFTNFLYFFFKTTSISCKIIKHCFSDKNVRLCRLCKNTFFRLHKNTKLTNRIFANIGLKGL